MCKWTKTAGLLFLAAASVYSSRAIVGAAGSGAIPAITAGNKLSLAARSEGIDRLIGAPADGATDVKLLEDSTDPFASAPTTVPTASADDKKSVEPTSQPAATEGRSVSSSEVSISDAGTVEIHVNDANLVEVLRMLSLQSQKNIVASKDVHGTVTANLYDVTVREALDAILHANGFAYREKGNFIYIYTTKEIAEIEKAERQRKTEVFHVYYTPAVNAATMIRPVLSKDGGEVAVTTPSKVGIASAPDGGGGNDNASDEVLVITDYPENLDAVRKILADIDQRPQQILLEATILRATLNEDNALGVDFNVLGGVDFTKVFNSNGQLTNATVSPDATVAQQAGSAGTGNSFSSPINGGFKVGYVSDSISVFLSALEQVTDTTVLANPKILALNRQQGEVFVGNEDGYYTTLTTETTTSQSVESLKVGTRLIFRPFIGADGFIRMEVHPEDSDGQVKANGLPSKSTTEVTSNVMVKDGHTIVIGGLFRESTVSAKSQVPFLGNLPVAGLLFKNQRDRTIREEVIILLTPHIIKDDTAYSRLSEDALKRANDLRIGTRLGLMPWGSSRLAEGWYEAARREMAKPNPDRGLAIWQLNCATNLNPQFAEAIELREQISGHMLTATDSSYIRGFVRRVILQDVAPATTAPTTMQSVDASSGENADGVPSTMPTNGDKLAEAPAMQPGINETPDATADATTQPSESESAETPLSEPMTDSAETSVADESVAIPSTQPAEQTTESVEKKSDAGATSTFLGEESSGEPAASESTSPSTEPSVQGTVTVTPVDEQSVSTDEAD